MLIMSVNIAVDGPAGAGKSSVAKQVSKDLKIIYVDTGALYRAIALFVLRRGASPSDGAAVSTLLPDITVEPKFVDGVQRVFLNGEDVSDLIRTEEVSMATSAVSAIPEVRAFLLGLQRKIAEENDVIMDGRDIGTVVLPNADLKIFLTASDTARAMRRYKELCERQGSDAPSYDEVLTLVRQRDRQDSGRETAPLKMADDAVLADTSDLDFEGSVKLIEHLIASNTALGGVRK